MKFVCKKKKNCLQIFFIFRIFSWLLFPFFGRSGLAAMFFFGWNIALVPACGEHRVSRRVFHTPDIFNTVGRVSADIGAGIVFLLLSKWCRNKLWLEFSLTVWWCVLCCSNNVIKLINNHVFSCTLQSKQKFQLMVLGSSSDLLGLCIDIKPTWPLTASALNTMKCI